MKPEYVCLVDLSSLFWRNWHGAVGKEPDAPFGITVGMIAKVLDGFDAHGIALDAGTSFRRELLATYKSGRPDKEPAAVEQLRAVIERLEADGRSVLRAEGFEADDVIATAVSWLRREAPGCKISIASSDKDLRALIAADVDVFDPFTGKTWRTDDVVQKLGIGPDKLAEFLALCGDKADAVPGVRGIGEKNAAKLLQDYGSIAGAMIAAADPDSKIAPAIRAALLAGDGDAALSLRLVTLRTDAPANFGVILSPPEPKPAEAEYGSDTGGFEDSEGEVTAAPLGANGQAGGAGSSSGEPPAPTPDAGAAAGVGGPSEGTPEPRPVTSLALVQHDPRWKLALEPVRASDAYVLAKHLFTSRLFTAYQNPDAVFAVILAGREMGLGAITSLRGFHVIKGKPVMSAALLVGVILKSGKAKYFSLKKSDREEAVYETWRHGDPKPVEMGYDVADAAAMGLLVRDERNGGWRGAPTKSGEPSQWDRMRKTMLRWRAAAELGRAVYPDVVSNCYVPGELDEGDVVIDAEFEEPAA